MKLESLLVSKYGDGITVIPNLNFALNFPCQLEISEFRSTLISKLYIKYLNTRLKISQYNAFRSNKSKIGEKD